MTTAVSKLWFRAPVIAFGALLVAIAPRADATEFTAASTTSAASVAPSGTPADSTSFGAALSGDGRFSAFSSYADNLVADDTNGFSDVFLHDNATNVITRLSVATDGTEGDFGSVQPSASGDGRYVAFSSIATNLVAGDTNAVADVFIRDTVANTTTRVSNGVADSDAPAISADGRYVAFQSNGSVLDYDTQTNTTTLVAKGAAPAISPDGHYVAYVSAGSVFVRDTQKQTTTRISRAGAESGNPSVSSNGRYVAFETKSGSATDVFVRDTLARVTTRLTRSTAYSGDAAISADGRYVAYYSYASGKPTVLVRDLHARTPQTVARQAFNPAITADGGRIAYETSHDVYVVTRQAA